MSEGARVVVGDIDKTRLDAVAESVRRLGAHRPVRRDRRNRGRDRSPQTAVDAFGRLDIAFANAGIGTSGLIVDSDVDDWKRTVDVCLVGPMLTIKHAAPRMIDGGAIVVTASLNAVQPGRGHERVLRGEGRRRDARAGGGDGARPRRHPRQRHRVPGSCAPGSPTACG